MVSELNIITYILLSSEVESKILPAANILRLYWLTISAQQIIPQISSVK